MRQSKYFLKTSKTQPSDDTSINARLLEQGGFAQKVMAGVYDFLPLGLRVLSKIENIVREEMDKTGANEMLMPVLHPKENWQATGRWTGLDVLFKIKSQHGQEYALAPTHEEIVTPAALSIIASYKDLPLAVYQIQTKFRDEPRAKSGLLRGREFRMKDLYSFHADAEDLENYYAKVAIPAYEKIFKRLGLDALLIEASGGTFSKFSHEFQVEIENGEDTIYICKKCGLGKNKDIYEPGVECTACGASAYREATASEVGNIFKLQDKYSKAFNLQYTAADGSKKTVLMGCYGIGTSRLMGVLVEKFHDEKGIIWPESAAPFKAHLIDLTAKKSSHHPVPINRDTPPRAGEERIYEDLLNHQIEVLYDDRDVSPGVKFADADLIGIPYRVVVSEKTLKEGCVEVKKRQEDKTKLVKINEITKLFNSGEK